MNKKIKQISMRILSCIMAIALACPMLTEIYVLAETSDSSQNTSSITTLSKNPFEPDWRIAIFYDGLSWNKFHNEVQDDIHDKSGIEKELKINYTNGKYGYADLHKVIDEKTT
ncbi:hypothetical protein [Ruminococcus sp. Marseille-P6503]|uniref:hypothetical protein n=1 Tax=Ruminococcus sp. Marseille-P6503 TaxID=2364796 RepID=UPI000F51FB58|nr:hypothetical protein [Ruminococcus sp. Marseille-P6503]